MRGVFNAYTARGESGVAVTCSDGSQANQKTHRSNVGYATFPNAGGSLHDSSLGRTHITVTLERSLGEAAANPLIDLVARFFAHKL